MANNAKASASGGIGFGGLLTIVFIVLKLIGVINWSWVWVLAPLWIPIALISLFLIIILTLTKLMENHNIWKNIR